MTEIQQVDPDQIFLSKLNSRRTYKPEAIVELADSIAANGQIAPAVVRKVDRDEWPDAAGAYELLVGQRRWLACTHLGNPLEVVVRDLDDRQASEIILVENVQREDLPPMQEAEAYARLLDLGHPDAKSIADRVGKKVSHVVRRLALLKLAPPAVGALEDGRIGIEHALLLARVPSASVQEELLAWALPRGEGDEEIASVRELREHIMRGHTRDLAGTPWGYEDAELVPSAGACSTCPKNTAVQADLWTEEAGHSICTDAECFASKAEKFVEITIKVDGRKALTKAQASDVFDLHGHVRPSSGFVDVEAQCYAVSPASPAYGKVWRKALGKKHFPAGDVLVAAGPDGMLRELIPERVAKAALRKAHPETSATAPEKGNGKRLSKEEREEAAQEEDLRERLGWALLAAIVRESIVKPAPPELVRILADVAAFGCPAPIPTEVSSLLGAETWSEISELVPKMPPEQARAVLVAAILAPVVEEDGPSSSRIAKLCKVYGIKPKAVEVELRRQRELTEMAGRLEEEARS